MQNNDDARDNDPDHDAIPAHDALPEQDPWAGLDGFTDAPEGLSLEGSTSIDDGSLDATDMPLAVFPPADAADDQFEQGGIDLPRVEEHSDIIPIMADAIRSGPHDIATDAFVTPAADGLEPAGFDDDEIARELGTPDSETAAEMVAETFAETDSGAVFGAAPETDPEAPVTADGWPTDEFRDDEAGIPVTPDPAAEQTEQPWDRDGEPHESIPLAAAVVAADVVASAPGKPGAATGRGRKKSGGIGQMVGVVLGGVMALPITYAILIWGFQKDPFQLGKQMPGPLAALLPQKLQPGSKPPRKQGAKPNLEAAPSLDDLSTTAEVAAPSADPAPESAAQPGVETGLETAVPEVAAVGTDKPGEPMAAAPVAADASAAAEPAEPAAMPAAPSPPPDAVAAVDAAPNDPPAAPGEPAMEAPVSIAAVPMTDVLPGLDALVADAAVTVVPPAAPAALPPLDLSGVDRAAELVAESSATLESVADPADPARDRLLVSWYQRLAQMGEELVKLETAAADSGRPLSPLPLAAAELLDRICVGDDAVRDLDRLGPMWLARRKRQADGVVLTATLDGSRQVGPYWSTRLVVAGSPSASDERSLTVISRLAPPASAGDRVLVSGVMFDGDSVWAADIRPILSPAEPPADDAPPPVEKAPPAETPPAETPPAETPPADAATPGPEDAGF